MDIYVIWENMHDKNIIGFRWISNFDNERLNIYLLAMELYLQEYGECTYHIDDEAFDIEGKIVTNYKGFYISKDMNSGNFWKYLMDAGKAYKENKNIRLLTDFITIEEMEL